MEFREEDIAHLLVNERRKFALLDTYRGLKKGNELIKQDMDSFKSELAFMGIGSRLTTGSRTYDSGTLDPALWSGLPVEILHVVFSHLPLPLIPQVRLLSKSWDQFITGQTPGFSTVCAKVNPKVFGMPCEEYDPDEGGFMAVRAYGFHSNKWHRFRITKYNMDSMEDFIHTMCAGDGGLVCIVSTSEDKEETPSSITVFNPLTRKYRKLPSLPQDVSLVQPNMVQLAMDRESKCYKVIVSVVGLGVGRGEGMGARIYSSETGEWSNPMACKDLIFGCFNHWRVREATCWEDNSGDEWLTSYLSSNCRGPSVYDCANGELMQLDGRGNPCTRADSHLYALVKDRLFVLHEKRGHYRDGFIFYSVLPLNDFCITEYRAQMSQPYWIKVRDHSCKAVQDDMGIGLRKDRGVEYDMRLYACKGFLLVIAKSLKGLGLQHELTWLYDMSTYAGRWLAIPSVPNEYTGDEGAMFELHWDAVP